MANNTKASVQQDEIGELRKRIEWMDEQRRKSARRLAELEQKVELQEREVTSRDQRIKDLERQLTHTTAQLARIPQVDVQLTKFQAEMMEVLEQYDKRRISSEQEMDRLRRVEHEGLTREIAEIRKELPAIPRLQQDVELRQAEEARLANLIANLQTAIPPIRNQVAEWERSLTFLQEKENKNNRNIGDIQTQLLEISKRWDPIDTRIDILANTLSKVESSRQDLIEAQVQQREIVKKWSEQIQIGEHERNKALENWRFVMQEHQETIERFSREWVKFSDQYKEAKMALQTLAEWQKQIEQQQREANELLKVELNRMQSRWDGFVLEDQQKWKTFQVEAEQRWQNAGRQEKQVQEQIHELQEKLVEMEEDKDMLWRIQAAQADAMRVFPRVWLEEIEKAKATDPNRRRQPTMVPVREE